MSQGLGQGEQVLLAPIAVQTAGDGLFIGAQALIAQLGKRMRVSLDSESRLESYSFSACRAADAWRAASICCSHAA